MSFLEKVTGKTKFMISLLLIMLVAVNRWKGLGLTTEDWTLIAIFAGLALGTDAIEGMVAQWTNGKKPEVPPKE
jgi:hypothetical protein